MAALTGYLALGTITDSGVFTEISGASGYARQAVSLSASGDGGVSNDATVTFPASTGIDWPKFDALGIFTVISGGAPLLAWRAPAMGRASHSPVRPYSIPAGAIQLAFPSAKSSLGTIVALSRDFTWAPGGVSYSSGGAGRATPTDQVRVATFGDSTASWRAYSVGTELVDARSASVPFPAGTANVIVSQYANKNMIDYFYPSAVMVANGGIGGQTTTQMAARTPGGVASSNRAIEDVLQLTPDVVLYRGGSINDFLGVTSGTLSASVTTATANAQSIISRLASDGALVLVHGIYGFTNGTNTATDQTATRSALLQQNAALAAICAGSNSGNLVYIDPLAVGLCNADGSYIPACTGDGTHLSYNGQWLLDQYVGQVLTQSFGPSQAIRFPGANVCPNPTLYASSGGTGTGWTTGSSSATRVASIANINNRNWQIATVTVTSPGGYGLINFPFDPSATGPMQIAASDVWGFEFDWFVTGLNGASVTPPSLNVTSRVQLFNTAGARIILDHVVTTGTWTSVSNGSMYGHIVHGPLTFPVDSAGMTSASSFAFQVTNPLDTTGFIMAASNPRIVKLNQPRVTI